MRQPELLPIAESLAGLIPRLARGLAVPEKDGLGALSLAQLRLCGILGEGPRPMSALSRQLGVSLSALTQIADRLERVRIVRRVAADDDRRVRCLRLTAQGETMMRKRHDARLRRSLALVEHLTSAQREQVMTAMETLVAACAYMQEAAAGGAARPSDAIDREQHGNGVHVNGNGNNGAAHPERAEHIGRAGSGRLKPHGRAANTKKSKTGTTP